MEWFAKKITDYILFKGVIEKRDYEIYKYGLETGLETMLCVVVSLLISIYLKSVYEFLIFIAIFFPLRAYVGGIHMKHFYACFICSCTVITIGLLFVKYAELDRNITFLIIMALMFIVHKLALLSKTKQDQEEDVMYFAKQRKKILIGIWIVAFVFWLLQATRLLMLILYIMIVVLGSLNLEINSFHKRIKEDVDEKNY